MLRSSRRDLDSRPGRCFPSVRLFPRSHLSLLVGAHGLPSVSLSCCPWRSRTVSLRCWIPSVAMKLRCPASGVRAGGGHGVAWVGRRRSPGPQRAESRLPAHNRIVRDGGRGVTRKGRHASGGAALARLDSPDAVVALGSWTTSCVGLRVARIRADRTGWGPRRTTASVTRRALRSALSGEVGFPIVWTVPGSRWGPRAMLHRQRGGGATQNEVGVQQHHLPFSAVSVRVFRPRPADPNRASGEGKDGSDPHFLAAGAARRVGWCSTWCSTWCNTRCNTTRRQAGVAPVRNHPCWKAKTPANGRKRTRRRVAR